MISVNNDPNKLQILIRSTSDFKMCHIFVQCVIFEKYDKAQFHLHIEQELYWTNPYENGIYLTSFNTNQI